MRSTGFRYVRLKGPAVECDEIALDFARSLNAAVAAGVRASVQKAAEFARAQVEVLEAQRRLLARRAPKFAPGVSSAVVDGSRRDPLPSQGGPPGAPPAFARLPYLFRTLPPLHATEPPRPRYYPVTSLHHVASIPLTPLIPTARNCLPTTDAVEFFERSTGSRFRGGSAR